VLDILQTKNAKNSLARLSSTSSKLPKPEILVKNSASNLPKENSNVMLTSDKPIYDVSPFVAESVD